MARAIGAEILSARAPRKQPDNIRGSRISQCAKACRVFHNSRAKRRKIYVCCPERQCRNIRHPSSALCRCCHARNSRETWLAHVLNSGAVNVGDKLVIIRTGGRNNHVGGRSAVFVATHHMVSAIPPANKSSLSSRCRCRTLSPVN